MTNINVTCKCGRVLSIKSRENFKIRDISVVCACGIGLVINANGTTEREFDIGNPIRKPEGNPA